MRLLMPMLGHGPLDFEEDTIIVLAIFPARRGN